LDADMLTLSGGMQQKIVLARWLLLGPKVLILDEPTRGVDIATRSSIYALLREIAGRGVGVLLISSDFEEILGLSDRVVVMADGADVTMIPARFLDVEKLAMFAAPRTSAQGTHRALEALAQAFGGAAFWVYAERDRAYCFDRVGTVAGAEPALMRGGFSRCDETSIPRALAAPRDQAFIYDDSGAATLLMSMVGRHGHDLGSIGLTLPVTAAIPEVAFVRRIMDEALNVPLAAAR
jgi:ribose transport system ATP-binding protein/rhamnose transport system ATP-binding protein